MLSKRKKSADHDRSNEREIIWSLNLLLSALVLVCILLSVYLQNLAFSLVASGFTAVAIMINLEWWFR